MGNNQQNCGSIWDASGCSLTALASAIAISISAQYSVDDLVTIATFLTALADLIQLNAQQRARLEELLENQADNKADTKAEIKNHRSGNL